MQKTLRVITIALALGLALSGCSTTEKNSNTPEGAFAIAEEYDKNERFEEAIRRYNEVKNKFPYSNYATRSELAIADVYFKQESYPEAQVSYQMFKELHPTAPQSDYVQFRIGLSFFHQLPTSIDRDLTMANDAIYNFSELIKKYPNSVHAEEAKEKRTAVIKMLAEKEEYIANFYFIRKIWGSALLRYENVYNNFRGFGFDALALSRASISAKKLGDESKFKKYYDILAQEFPDSKELATATKGTR